MRRIALVSGIGIPTALVVGAISKWFPSFATPIWIIGLGLLIGLVITAAYLGILSLLSFVPALGRFADVRSRAIVASLIIGLVAGLMLCGTYVPIVEDQQFAPMLYLPLMTIGALFGFSTVFGLWHRTRSELWEFLSEGVVPYLLSCAAVLIGFGLLATVFVKDPGNFFESLTAVRLIGDGTDTIRFTIEGTDVEDPDLAPFVPAEQPYELSNLAAV
ncbi:MAG: ABC transporter permease, partial [Planctomycetota bacterium]